MSRPAATFAHQIGVPQMKKRRGIFRKSRLRRHSSHLQRVRPPTRRPGGVMLQLRMLRDVRRPLWRHSGSDKSGNGSRAYDHSIHRLSHHHHHQQPTQRRPAAPRTATSHGASQRQHQLKGGSSRSSPGHIFEHGRTKGSVSLHQRVRPCIHRRTLQRQAHPSLNRPLRS